jgi:uncharacterized glyoxalase superfamily protein PhnB/ribosomal protein S18 acetylase RimI-like enzyme
MEIRAATAADYDAYARLFAELGVADPIPPRERFAAEISPRTLVSVAATGAVVGYAVCEVLTDVGYVRNLVSDPRLRRTGIGAALMAALHARFVAAGAHTWCLNVKPDNAAAIGLYERCGLRAAYRSTTLRFARDVALAAPPAELALAAALAADDEHTEHVLRLLRGQLASARARPSRQVLHLRRGAEIVGVGVFVDTFPGAVPFRVTEPALGVPFAALLRALAPDRDFMQVVAEDDDALRDALVAAGAHPAMEILHMRGALAEAPWYERAMPTHHVPKDHNAVSPYLVVADAAGLIAFVARVFGATEIVRHAMPDGTIMHAEVRIDDSVVMIGQAADRSGHPMVHVYVADVDATHARALAAGATSTRPPTTMPFGDRIGMAIDPFGVHWAMSTHLEDIAPAELARRMAQQKPA